MPPSPWSSSSLAAAALALPMGKSTAAVCRRRGRVPRPPRVSLAGLWAGGDGAGGVVMLGRGARRRELPRHWWGALIGPPSPPPRRGGRQPPRRGIPPAAAASPPAACRRWGRQGLSRCPPAGRWASVAYVRRISSNVAPAAVLYQRTPPRAGSGSAPTPPRSSRRLLRGTSLVCLHPGTV